VMNACRENLAQAGLRLMLTPVTRREDFLETLEDFAARRMKAALVVPPEDNIPITATVTANMPVLSFLSPCKGKNVFLIAPDDIQTGRDAVDYLTSRGHERILHVTYARRAKAVRDRLIGYRRRMIELGRRPAVCIAHGGEENLYSSLISHRPTAVFCHNDWLALVVIQTLQARGNNIPYDVSVLGVDNSPTFVALYPNLTTMEFPIDQVAANVCAKIQNPAATIAFDRFKIIERATVHSRPKGD
jgi:DNA-binding LacI/PurR family transcriptional regulator